MTDRERVAVAIIGSGNIGTDLMIKIVRQSKCLHVAAMAGVDPQSEGLARAKQMGIATTHEGVHGLMRLDPLEGVKIAFDATSAGAHALNYNVLKKRSIQVIDLTPAAIGPYLVPTVNIDEHLRSSNINMVTCGGQATIPIVKAVSRVAKVHYAEIIASIASKSAGPGTRANIDEFTQTTARALESVGGAARGKAIIVLNPAEPPLIMRDTVYTLSETIDESVVRDSILQTIAEVQRYVPGYRLKQELQFDRHGSNNPINIPDIGYCTGLKTSVFLEIEGAGHYLPPYAGNLDIMTSAALTTAERIAQSILRNAA